MSQTARLSSRKTTRSYVLIADGFDDLEVVTILRTFRRAGLKIQLVALTGRMIYSQCAIGLRADLEYSEMPPKPAASDLLILPTGGSNGRSLRRDPRLRDLLARYEDANARILVTDGHSELARDIHHFPNSRSYLPPDGQTFPDFVERIAGRLAYA